MFPVHEKKSVRYYFFSRLSGASQAGDNWLSAACKAADNHLSLAVPFFLQITCGSHLLVTLLPHEEFHTLC